MSEDQTMAQESATPEADDLKRSIEALEAKNRELIIELRNAKKAPKVPDGVNVDELLEFKRQYEQTQLEQQGKYSEAREALEKQFREAAQQKDQRIAELESRVRELELVSPAVSALAEIVHDPDLVLKTKLQPEHIEREADGTVVVVDGYERVPVTDWARNNLPAWMQKQPKPQGSGASASGSPTTLPSGVKNPFLREHFNLTEQSRLFKTDRDLYDRLKAAAKGR